MRILGIYFDTLGHSAAEENLKTFLPKKFRDCAYDSIKLSEIRRTFKFKTKLASLLGYPLLPTLQHDLFLNRFRSELSYSLLIYWFLGTIDKSKYDVFHFRTQSICLLLWRFFKKYPTVITMDMSTQQLIQLRVHNRPFYLPITWLEKKVFRSGARIVSYSWHTASAVSNDYDAPASHSISIHPSVKDEFFQLQRQPGALPRILFVGNDFRRKGGDLLLKVFEQHFSEKAELHLVSNDPLLSELKASNGVFFHRNILPNSKDLLSLFAQADFFVLPTREEAYGIVFSEAMAAGLPCIGTRTMAIPELIEENKRGFLIEIDHAQQLEEKMRLLIEDSALRERMALEARKHALANYTLEHFIKGYHQIFETVRKSDAQH